MAKNKTEDTTSTNIKAARAFLDLLDRIKALRWKGIIDGILKLLFLVCFAMGLKFIINPRPTVEYFISLQEKISSLTESVKKCSDSINEHKIDEDTLNTKITSIVISILTEKGLI